jgi:hypothetical protein
MSPKQTSTSQPSASSNLLFLAVIVAVIGGGVFLFMRPASPASPATTEAAAAADAVPATAQQPVRTAPAKPGQPDDAALPPLAIEQYSTARPVDEVRAVYMFAAEHPEVLQYVPCFCGCESRGHSGNDDCFVQARDAEGRVTAWEPHGMACAVCIDVGSDARRMYTSGASVTQIREAIEAKYRPLASTITPTPMPEGHAH